MCHVAVMSCHLRRWCSFSGLVHRCPSDDGTVVVGGIIRVMNVSSLREPTELDVRARVRALLCVILAVFLACVICIS